MWISLVIALISALAPVLTDWLKKLLEQSGKELDQTSTVSAKVVTDAAAVREVFARVRAEIRRQWWNPRYWFVGGYLRRCEYVALNRARALYACAYEGGPEVVLDPREKQYVNAA